MKICSRCRVRKKNKEFRKDITRKDGIHPWCKSCLLIDRQKYYNSNRNRILAHSKEYEKKNKSRIQIRKKLYYENNLDKFKDRHKKNRIKINEGSRNRRLKYAYGISPNQYKILFDLQEGKCAICGKSDLGKRKNLSIDHDHKTNKVRGLLCTKCNSLLGFAEDDIDKLMKAIKYLEKQEDA